MTRSFATRAAGIAIGCTFGLAFSATTVWAANQAVQAIREAADITVAGHTVGASALLYDKQSYMNVAALQAALRDTGISASWNGRTLVLAKAHTGSGSADATHVVNPWFSYNTGTKTVNWVVKAGDGNDNGGFNFDGYSAGKMVVTVPTGWHVHVAFTNLAAFPHSALVVPYSERMQNQFTDAFSGSASANPTDGVDAGKSSAFTFTATHAGQFALVCGVPGHSADGMWETFVVSSRAAAPTFAVK